MYSILVYTWMAVGLITFFFLFKVQAPFGRHTRAGWGPVVDNRLGWIIMEATVLLVLYAVLSAAPRDLGGVARMMVGLFTVHYVHRALIFPWFLRTGGKKMPMAITLSAMGFNVVNGSLLGYYFGHLAEYPDRWLTDARFLAGTALFLLGAAINLHADYALIRLRKPGETGYRIPEGGLFNWISCPNHLGEILEWAGFALLTWSLPGLAFAFWTFANLAPRAWAHHLWYRKHFPEYPPRRRALIPGFW